MNCLTVIGVVSAVYAIYIGLIFFVFTIDLKRDVSLFQGFPSVNDDYDKPFRIMGFVHMLFWILVWGTHHSLFARG